MSFGLEGFAAVRPVQVVLITSRYRVSGMIQTRFSRVAEILNQQSSTHLPVEAATVEEHGAASDALRSASSVLVAVDEILVMLAPDLADAPSGDMRVPKQPVRAQLAIPPVWLSGTVHVAVGSRPSDGLLNLADRFVPMTDVTITAPAHPALDHAAAVAAVRRDRAHLILFEGVAAAGDG